MCGLRKITVKIIKYLVDRKSAYDFFMKNLSCFKRISLMILYSRNH